MPGAKEQGSQSPDDPNLEDDIFDDADSEASKAEDEGKTEGDDSAKSSDAQKEDDADLLSVARSAVEKKEGDADSSTAGTGEEDGDKTEDDDSASEKDKSKQAAEPDDENFTDVPFHKHPRFKQLIEQRNAFREDAQRYNNVQTFLTNNGIEPNEAAELLMIGGLMKRNPVEAWKRALPTIQKLAVAAGAVLPNDLAERVRRQEITREAAIEISRARAQSASVEADRRFSDGLRQRQDQQRTVQQVQGAVTAWERQKRSSDPDFDALNSDLQTEIQARLYRQGQPSDPIAAMKMLDEAYDAVVQRRKAATAGQRKPEKKPVTGGRVAGNSRPEPRSMKEAMMQAVASGK